MNLIDDLVGCKECDQYIDDFNLSKLNCCNKRICINCENIHNCSNSISTSPSSINIDKSIENLYSSFLSINSSYSIGLGTSIDNSNDYDSNDYDDDEELYEQDQVFEHIVFPTDTLQGISIKYNCSINELKSINKIRSSSPTTIISKTILLVPKKQNQIRQQAQDILSNKEVLESLKNNLIKRFIKKSKCNDQSQVIIYLEKHGYDFFKALIDFNNNKNEQLLKQKQEEQEQQQKQQQEQVFKYQEFNFGSTPEKPKYINENNNVNNIETKGGDDEQNNSSSNSNSKNLLNNSDFLIKSYREKYSDIPKQTAVKNINKTSIRKVQRTCCSWF